MECTGSQIWTKAGDKGLQDEESVPPPSLGLYNPISKRECASLVDLHPTSFLGLGIPNRVVSSSRHLSSLLVGTREITQR